MSPSPASTCTAFVFTFTSALVIENAQAYNLTVRFQKVCQPLLELNVSGFIDRSLAQFKYLCKDMAGADALAFRLIYNDLFASTFLNPDDEDGHMFRFYSGNKTGLVAQGNWTTFLVELAVNKSAPEAMAEIETYKSDYYKWRKDILGVGINFKYETAPQGAAKKGASAMDKVKCEWEAKLYSDTGEVKKTFPETTAVLDCP